MAHSPILTKAGCIALLFGVHALASQASAQAWLADRAQREGAGVRLGNFELHPGVGAEIGYDSNWLRRTNEVAPNLINGAPNAPRKDAAILRLTPSLSLRTLGAQRKEGQGGDKDPGPVEFDLTLSGTYREFLGDEVIRRQRNLSAALDGRVTFAPKRPLSFDLLFGYTRSIRANTLGNPDYSFNTSSPMGGAVLRFNPNRGSFTVDAGYRFTANLFEQREPRGYNNLRHNVALNESWQFRPRTALFHSTSLDFVSYPNAENAATRLTSSMPLRSRFGLNGLLFNRLGATVALGYGATFTERGHASTRQFDGVIGNAELRVYLTGNREQQVTDVLPATQSTLALGFERDFQISYLSDFFTLHRGYLGLNALLGGRALVGVSAGLGAHTYAPVYLNVGGTDGQRVTDPFTAIVPDVQLQGEYRFSRSFAITLNGKYSQSITDVKIPYNNYNPPMAFAMSWQRFEAFAGARWFL